MEPPRWPGTRRWSRGCRAWPPSTTSTAGVRRGSCGRSASTPSFPSPRVPPRSREYRRGSRSRSRQLRSRGGRGRCCTGSPTPGRARCRMTPTNGRTTSPARSGTRSPAAASGWSADASTPPSAWPTAPGAGGQRPGASRCCSARWSPHRAGASRPSGASWSRRGAAAATGSPRHGTATSTRWTAPAGRARPTRCCPPCREAWPSSSGSRPGCCSTTSGGSCASRSPPSPRREASGCDEHRGVCGSGRHAGAGAGLRAAGGPAGRRAARGAGPVTGWRAPDGVTRQGLAGARRVPRAAGASAAWGPGGGEHLVHAAGGAPGADDHPWPSEAWVLPGQGHLHLLGPYRGSWRLWLVDVRVPPPLPTYLAEHGRPLRPEGVATDWPLEVYQSCFAREPGSTAMASAGRAFTPELLTALVSSGIVVAPLLLHTCGLTGEDGGPLPERYHVPPVTARLVNHTRASGGRVIAVGTTVVRALESVAAVNGVVRPARGWTEQVVTPERGVRVVDGLLTGWHEPGGSHLRLLEAVAGLEPLGLAYRAALEHGFAWGTFGDLHLILPGSRRRARR